LPIQLIRDGRKVLVEFNLTLHPDLEFDNFKQHLERNTFECIFWLNGLFFSCDDPNILKEEVKPYPMTQSSPPNTLSPIRPKNKDPIRPASFALYVI
jgi:hypothetical protein